MKCKNKFRSKKIQKKKKKKKNTEKLSSFSCGFGVMEFFIVRFKIESKFSDLCLLAR
jgi:hypothetical protein